MVNLNSTVKMLQDKRDELLDQLAAVDKAIAALSGTTARATAQESQARQAALLEAPPEFISTILKPKRVLSEKHKQALLDGRRRAREGKRLAATGIDSRAEPFVPAIAQPLDQIPRLVKRNQNHNRELTIEPLAEEMPPTPEEAFVG